MTNSRSLLLIVLLTITALAVWSWATTRTAVAPDGREEVVFWHFWGGRDRPIVERIVKEFNTSQDRYWVRAIARPGSNLDLKFFLSLAGGDPPDLLCHDDPVVADWAHRGVLTPMLEAGAVAEITGGVIS